MSGTFFVKAFSNCLFAMEGFPLVSEINRGLVIWQPLAIMQ